MVVLLLWLWWDERNKWRKEGEEPLWRWRMLQLLCLTDFRNKPTML
jgi:hypothetical protein